MWEAYRLLHHVARKTLDDAAPKIYEHEHLSRDLAEYLDIHVWGHATAFTLVGTYENHNLNEYPLAMSFAEAVGYGPGDGPGDEEFRYKRDCIFRRYYARAAAPVTKIGCNARVVEAVKTVWLDVRAIDIIDRRIREDCNAREHTGSGSPLWDVRIAGSR